MPSPVFEGHRETWKSRAGSLCRRWTLSRRCRHFAAIYRRWQTVGEDRARTRLGDCAPLALFVSNRPHHTRRTIDALLGNDFVSQTDLIVFSAAARDAASAAAVSEV